MNDTAKANYKANTTQVFGEVGYTIPMGPSSTMEPFAGVGYSDLRTRGFTESGSVAVLSGKSQNAQTTRRTLGLRGATKVELGQTTAAVLELGAEVAISRNASLWGAVTPGSSVKVMPIMRAV